MRVQSTRLGMHDQSSMQTLNHAVIVVVVALRRENLDAAVGSRVVVGRGRSPFRGRRGRRLPLSRDAVFPDFDLGRMADGRSRRAQHRLQAQDFGNGAGRRPTAGDLDENGFGLFQDGVDVDGAGHVVDVLEDFRESKFIFDQDVFLGVEESDADEEVEIAAGMTRPQNLPQRHDVRKGKLTLEMN